MKGYHIHFPTLIKKLHIRFIMSYLQCASTCANYFLILDNKFSRHQLTAHA